MHTALRRITGPIATVRALPTYRVYRSGAMRLNSDRWAGSLELIGPVLRLRESRGPSSVPFAA